MTGSSFSIDNSSLSNAMLFPRDSIEYRKRWNELLKIEDCNVRTLKSVFYCLAGKNTLEKLQISGLLNQLYVEASSVLPISLPIHDMQKILEKYYPEGVFHNFTSDDLSVVSRIFPKAYDLGLYRTGDETNMLGCVAGVIRPLIDKLDLGATHNEIEKFCTKISINLDTADCLKVIRQLFPDGMFHEFSNPEILFMVHLFPKGREINEGDLNFFTECLIGVMRSLILREFRSNPEGKALLQQYLNLESSSSSTVSSVQSLKTVNKVVCWTVTSICSFESLAPSPFSSYWPRKISAQDREAIQNAFKEVAYSDCISIDADCALRVWNSLVPRGIFHVFSQKEAVLLNFMRPIDLSAEGRLIWMQLLAGSYKSMFFTKNISQPPSNELMEFLEFF
jgi:hypothetical protein